MKPHTKVIQRNGVDIFVTSSVVMKEVSRRIATFTPYGTGLAQMVSVGGQVDKPMQETNNAAYDSLRSMNLQYLANGRITLDAYQNFTSRQQEIKSPN